MGSQKPIARIASICVLLSALPASGALSQAGFSVSNGFLLVGDYPQLNTFSATGLDLGIATSLNLDGKNVNYQ